MKCDHRYEEKEFFDYEKDPECELCGEQLDIGLKEKVLVESRISFGWRKFVFYMKYALYYHLTMEERIRYTKAEQMGYDCIDSYDSSKVLYGSETTFVYDKTKPPKRRYLSYKEYKELYYPERRGVK